MNEPTYEELVEKAMRSKRLNALIDADKREEKRYKSYINGYKRSLDYLSKDEEEVGEFLEDGIPDEEVEFAYIAGTRGAIEDLQDDEKNPETTEDLVEIVIASYMEWLNTNLEISDEIIQSEQKA